MDAILAILGVAMVLGAAIGAGILIRKNRAVTGTEPQESPTGLVLVAQFGYRHEAEMALGYLNDGGIDAVRLVDDAGYGFSFSPPRIMVPAERADEARDILESVGIEVIRG